MSFIIFAVNKAYIASVGMVNDGIVITNTLFIIDSKNRFTVVSHVKRQEEFAWTRVELCKNLRDINLQHSA